MKDVSKFKCHLHNLLDTPTPDAQLIAELDFDGFPQSRFNVTSNESSVLFDETLALSEKALFLANYFSINNDVRLTIDNLYQNELGINQLYSSIQNPDFQKIEFFIENDNFDSSKPTVCLFLHLALLGTHKIGALFAAEGNIQGVEENKYTVDVSHVGVIKKIAIQSTEILSKADILEEFRHANMAYDEKSMNVVNIGQIEIQQ